MSRRRTAPQKDRPGKGPNGRNRCRQCLTEITAPRRYTFCSDGCVHDWKILRDPNYVREQVRKRDQGICAACGLDCLALGEEVQGIRKRIWRAWKDEFPGRTMSYDGWHFRRFLRGHPDWIALDQTLVARGFRGWQNRRELWDADHIQPVALGGGECTLENFQTLCLACHKAKTSRDMEKIRPVVQAGRQELLARLMEARIRYFLRFLDLSGVGA